MTNSQLKSMVGVGAGYVAAICTALVPVLYATHHPDAAMIVAAIAAALAGGGVSMAGWNQSMSKDHVSVKRRKMMKLPVSTQVELGVREQTVAKG